MKRYIHIGVAIVSIVVLLLTDNSVVLAQDFTTPGEEPNVSQRAFESFQTETPWYDETAVDCAVAASDGGDNTRDVKGSDNEDTVFKFFVPLLVTKYHIPIANAVAQAAGLAGNWQQESNIDPTSVDGGAHGIVQWEGSRWNELQKYVTIYNRQAGKSVAWSDLMLQLNFVVREFDTYESSAFNAIKATTNPSDAAQVISVRYERPGDPRIENRIKYAIAAYNRHSQEYLGPNATPIATSTPQTAQTCPTNSPGSSANINVDGYAWPVAPIKQIDFSTLPCGAAGQYPGYGARGWVGTYTDMYGHSQRIRTCHHDNTPAFDLMHGTASQSAGQAVYAITKGRITHVNWSYCNPGSCGSSGKNCNSIQFLSTLDKHYYWYGHVLANDTVRSRQDGKGQEFAAGEALGTTATVDYGPRCWGGGPHLHIDRGCENRAGVPQTAGNPDCRSPLFLQLLPKVWGALPK